MCDIKHIKYINCAGIIGIVRLLIFSWSLVSIYYLAGQSADSGVLGIFAAVKTGLHWKKCMVGIESSTLDLLFTSSYTYVHII